ncbi:unnamed protein product [Rangifer tarandus platyrhynchus]|uniref:Uncharacterized protein n=1 Tax=Rangifer tarandus platyrhynchus TaxID=3082113 RepID=A0ABN9A3P6_RANTA|nr:unnamed protein product [Rangifer tarandus platyrhynchus]
MFSSLGDFMVPVLPFWGFPSECSDKESTCQCRRRKRCLFNPWVEKIAWSRKWHPIPVFLFGKFHEQRSLVGYSPRVHKESELGDMTEHTHCHSNTGSCHFLPDCHCLPTGLPYL